MSGDDDVFIHLVGSRPSVAPAVWMSQILDALWSAGVRFDLTRLLPWRDVEDPLEHQTLAALLPTRLVDGFVNIKPTLYWHKMVCRGYLIYHRDICFMDMGIARGALSTDEIGPNRFYANYRDLLDLVEVVIRIVQPIYGYGFYGARDRDDEFMVSDLDDDVEEAVLVQQRRPTLVPPLFTVLFEYLGPTLQSEADALLATWPPASEVRQVGEQGKLLIKHELPFTQDYADLWEHLRAGYERVQQDPNPHEAQRIIEQTQAAWERIDTTRMAEHSVWYARSNVEYVIHQLKRLMTSSQ